MLQLNQIVLIYEEGVLSYNDIKSWQDMPSSHINTTWHEITNSEMKLFCAAQQIRWSLVKNQREKLWVMSTAVTKQPAVQIPWNLAKTNN